MPESPRVTMLSQYGSPTRGISPYSDMLSDQLKKKLKHFETATYRAAYPQLNIPTNSAKNHHQGVHYFNPFSWSDFSKKSQHVAHIQYWTSFSAFYLYFIVKKLRRLGKRSIITVHNASPHESIPFTSIFEHRLLNEADHIITHTEHGKQKIIDQHSISQDKISVIPHGVEIHGEDTIKNENNDQHKKYLLAAGNIRPYKGTDLLIDAWKNIFDQHPDYELIIAGRLWGGGNSLVEKLSGKILGTKKFSEEISRKIANNKEFNIEKKFAFLSDEELEKLIKNASMCLFPYRSFSGQSGVASKSASYGTPVVCSNQEGLTQLCIDSSFIIKNLTTSEISEVISRKISELSEATRVDQRKKVQKFSWEIIADLHIKTYCLVAEKNA